MTRQQSGAVRSEARNGAPDAVETLMSPLAHAQRSAKRQQLLSAAQMAHLRHTAYRGVDTTAHQSPAALRKPSVKACYRGISYETH